MKRSRLELIAILSAIVVFILIICTYFYYYCSDYRTVFSVEPSLENVEQTNELFEENDYKEDISNNSIVYILFLGIDRNDERDLSMGIYRTDTIAVSRIDVANNSIRVLSIPRDTYTYIPIENKLDKINHSYAFGSLQGRGPEESINAVNYLLGSQVINYYFLMDMEPIPEIVNEIGGVTIDVDMNMKDSGIEISKGIQVLNGEQAELYLRWRYSPGGDIDRIKHQQKFMAALFKQQKESGKLLETIQMILKYRNNVKTDLSLKQTIGLARFMTEISNNNVEYSIIPGDSQMINGVSYWVMEKDETQTIIKNFLE